MLTGKPNLGSVRAAPRSKVVAAKADGVTRRYEQKLAPEHRAYVGAHGEDPAEITAWIWNVEGAAR